MSLAEKILSANPNPTQTVYVPEWDCKVLVKTWDTEARKKYFEWLEANQDDKYDHDTFLALVVLLSSHEEDGKPIFDDAQLPALAKSHLGGRIRVASIGLRLNYMMDTEAAKKNSKVIPNSPQSSQSPENCTNP